MEMRFKSDKEREFYESGKLLRKDYGELARTITKRLNHIKACVSVQQLFDLGIGKPHYLTGDYDKCIALSVSPNYRLIIKPVYSNEVDLSKLNLSTVTVVTIMEVTDYHG